MPPIAYFCHQFGLCPQRTQPCPGCPSHCAASHTAHATQAAQPLTPPNPRVTDAEYVAALHRHGNPPDEALHIVSLPHELRRWARRTLALLLAALAVGLAAGYWSGGA